MMALLGQFLYGSGAKKPFLFSFIKEIPHV